MSRTALNWLSFIPDETYLSEITIPGTHNSGSFSCNVFARNQSLPLVKQLEGGVRFFDVRCRHVNDHFHIHHGSSSARLLFDADIVAAFVRFLEQQPSETILVLVSTEYVPRNNQAPFFEVFLRYVDKTRRHWFLADHCPRLAYARGKIVLLRRFYSPHVPLGIDMSGWRDSATFELHNQPQLTFVIQDEYKLNAGQKSVAFKALMQQQEQHLATTRSSSSDSQDRGRDDDDDKLKWFINYASARCWPHQPPLVIAWKMNKLVCDCLTQQAAESMPRTTRGGTILVDFAHDHLIRTIFEFNFAYENETATKLIRSQ